jgi:hypothetical protein
VIGIVGEAEVGIGHRGWPSMYSEQKLGGEGGIVDELKPYAKFVDVHSSAKASLIAWTKCGTVSVIVSALRDRLRKPRLGS